MLDFKPSAMDRAGTAAARAGLGLHQVRYVLAAAEHGGFRRAARWLGIQQSAVSHRIRELEERLGARLFERTPEGVRLTTAGEAFVRGATEAVVDLDQVVRQAVEHGRREESRLRVGVLAGLGGAPLEPLLRELLLREPEVRIDVMEASGSLLLESILREQCDVAFVVEAPKATRPMEAWRERLMVAVPYDHPLASVEVVSWPQLVFERLLAPSGLARHLQVQVARHSDREALSEQAAGISAVLRLVGLGQGLALLPEGGATRANGVVFRPVARSFLPVRAVVGRFASKAAATQLLAILQERRNRGQGGAGV